MISPFLTSYRIIRMKKNRAAEPLANQLAAIERRLGPIEYRPIAEFKVYDRKLRKHSEPQLIKLAASIREFGFALPLLADSDGVLIVGHARLEAAKRLGLAELPVIVADHWSRAQVKAYRLADNRLGELGEWNNEELVIELIELLELDEVEIDTLGWETGEIDKLFDLSDAASKSPAEDPADAQIAPPAVPVSRVGDIWLLGKHRLMCASSLEAATWAQLMNGEIAAMAFSDPPYNVPIAGHVSGLGKIEHAEFAQASGEMSKAEFTQFLTGHIGAMSASVRNGALLYLCMDWRHMGELGAAIEACGLALINVCVWNKSNGGMGSLYRSKHELVFVTKKGSAPHTNNVQLGRHGRYRANVWDYPGVNTFGAGRMEDLADHPTVKPLSLVADAIRDVTKPGEIVVDGFMGSGTTILAAHRYRARHHEDRHAEPGL
jgi:DNA modification methylase